MRALVWWLRSAFCRHDWQNVSCGEVVKVWPPSMVRRPVAVIIIKECKKCQWRWMQRNGL